MELLLSCLITFSSSSVHTGQPHLGIKMFPNLTPVAPIHPNWSSALRDLSWMWPDVESAGRHVGGSCLCPRLVTIPPTIITSVSRAIKCAWNWKMDPKIPERVFGRTLKLKWVSQSIKVLVTQSCPALCNPVDCSPPGSSIHGILQARILEWVAIPFSRGSFWPRICQKDSPI